MPSPLPGAVRSFPRRLPSGHCSSSGVLCRVCDLPSQGPPLCRHPIWSVPSPPHFGPHWGSHWPLKPPALPGASPGDASGTEIGEAGLTAGGQDPGPEGDLQPTR
ncbi:hypothetical protein CapIbe_014951 [Capra ibex]